MVIYVTSIGIALMNIIAMCIYAMGLISPLTPSEGRPSLMVLLLSTRPATGSGGLKGA